LKLSEQRVLCDLLKCLRRRGNSRSALEKLGAFGKQLAITGIEPVRCSLEPDQIQEVLSSAADENLDRLFMTATVPFPCNPSVLTDFFSMLVLILDADEKLRGIVHLRIESDKVTVLG
jgi:hypothetical protein